VGYLIRVPIDDDQAGGYLVVEAVGLRDDLGLAAGAGQDKIVQASRSLAKSLNDVTPGLRKVVERLRAVTPGEFTVEFGLTIGAEAGVVLAKGSVEAHFTVTATWKPGEGGCADASTQAAAQTSVAAPGVPGGPGTPGAPGGPSVARPPGVPNVPATLAAPGSGH
jgi:hypothetical protein